MFRSCYPGLSLEPRRSRRPCLVTPPPRSLLRRVRRRRERVGSRARIFLLRGLDPAREFLIRYDAHRNRHIGVVLAAELGTLAVIHADLARLEPGLVETARDRVDLDAESRHREGVDDIGTCSFD